MSALFGAYFASKLDPIGRGVERICLREHIFQDCAKSRPNDGTTLLKRAILSERHRPIQSDVSESSLSSLLASVISGWGDSGTSIIKSHLSVLASNSLLLLDGVLGTSSLGLGLELLLTDDLSLLSVNGLNQDVLVLELVTLGSQVELVVHLLVDLLGITISLEEATEDAESAHPQDLLWHTGVSGTLSLSSANMTT